MNTVASASKVKLTSKMFNQDLAQIPNIWNQIFPPLENWSNVYCPSYPYSHIALFSDEISHSQTILVSKKYFSFLKQSSLRLFSVQAVYVYLKLVQLPELLFIFHQISCQLIVVIYLQQRYKYTFIISFKNLFFFLK